MANDADFDALTLKATESNFAIENSNALFGAAFALSHWYFISRGELPDVYPYVASNAQYADNQPMIRAFTDTIRLQRFARENNLTDADGNALMLSIPTANIVEYLEGFIDQGAFGIWFNSDSQSEGFFVPLKQLRPIKEHLAKINRTNSDAQKPEVITLKMVVQEGLMMPTGEIKPAPYTSDVFWRVPSDRLEGEKIKPDYYTTFERELSGGKSETIEGAFYIPIDYSVKILTPEEVKATDWRTVKEKSDDSCTFFIFSGGTINSVSAEDFQKDVDRYFQTPAKSAEPPPRSNLQNWGLAESPDGEIDLNLTINKVGTVNFNTEMSPFYQAIVPLLEDYKGAGEYITLLRFEPDGMSQTVENIAENAHGAYLQIRRFLYLNPKNNVRIGVNSIHSKSLRHVQSNAELLVSFELCKNLDNQTAVFYHAFQGAGGEIKKLINAIQPVLEASGYQAVSQ
jgi:hypothetical protein